MRIFLKLLKFIGFTYLLIFALMIGMLLMTNLMLAGLQP